MLLSTPQEPLGLLDLHNLLQKLLSYFDPHPSGHSRPALAATFGKHLPSHLASVTLKYTYMKIFTVFVFSDGKISLITPANSKKILYSKLNQLSEKLKSYLVFFFLRYILLLEIA